MMESFEKFFIIDLEYLGKDQIFSFHLFIYNPENKQYSSFLHANSPLTKDKKQFLKFIAQNGGKLAIPLTQKRTFLHQFDYSAEDIPSLKNTSITPAEKIRETKILKIYGKDEKSGEPFNFNEQFLECLKNDNFLPIIERARDEIQCFSLKKSHTVSLASFLANQLLSEDNIQNRILSISFFLAKILNVTNEKDLSDLVCAAFLFHLGFTQIEMDLIKKPLIDLDDSGKKMYQKHPGFVQHLIRKNELETSERCMKLINQHHEKVDGSGYPENLTESHIDLLAQILGAVAHFIEFSSGKITGNIQPPESTIRAMYNKNFTSGLEFQFSDKILENLYSLINKELVEKKAA